MSNFYLPKQPRINDERQLFAPDQLAEGMHIGVIAVIEGTRYRERLLRAAGAFSGILGRGEDEGRFQAARKGWQHNDLSGSLPQWRGIVQWCNEGGARVQITGQLKDDFQSYADFMNTDPADLPAPKEPALLHSTFSGMGLAVVASSSRLGSGLWEPYATLLLAHE